MASKEDSDDGPIWLWREVDPMGLVIAMAQKSFSIPATKAPFTEQQSNT